MKSRRGFAAMDPEAHRVLSGRGGRAARARGKAHEFTPAEARSAGRKGGKVPKGRARARAARVAEATRRPSPACVDPGACWSECGARRRACEGRQGSAAIESSPAGGPE
jgi:hypothetical protein